MTKINYLQPKFTKVITECVIGSPKLKQKQLDCAVF